MGVKQLKNRTSIGIYLPNEQAEWLRKKSESTAAPISRLVEAAIAAEMKKEDKAKAKLKEARALAREAKKVAKEEAPAVKKEVTK